MATACMNALKVLSVFTHFDKYTIGPMESALF